MHFLYALNNKKINTFCGFVFLRCNRQRWLIVGPISGVDLRNALWVLQGLNVNQLIGVLCSCSYRILQSASWKRLSEETLQNCVRRWSRECLARFSARLAWCVSNSRTTYKPKSRCSHSMSESAPWNTWDQQGNGTEARLQRWDATEQL